MKTRAYSSVRYLLVVMWGAVGCGSATLSHDAGAGGEAGAAAGTAGHVGTAGAGGHGGGAGASGGSAGGSAAGAAGGAAGHASGGGAGSGTGGTGGGGGHATGLAGQTGTGGGIAGASGTGGSGTGGTGSAGHAGAGGTTGTAGAGGSASCTITCAPSAYCSDGACKSRTTEFPLGTTLNPVAYITTGSDGNLWFTAGQVGRMTTTGTVTLFNQLVATGLPSGTTAQSTAGITLAPDGNVWFPLVAGTGAGYLGSITPAGVIANYQITNTGYPTFGQIAAGPDGNLWAPEHYATPESGSNLVWVSTLTGTATPKSLPSTYADPLGAAAGPDGNV